MIPIWICQHYHCPQITEVSEKMEELAVSEPPKEAAVVDPFAEESEEETKVRKKKEKKQTPAPQGRAILQQQCMIE